jgi:hypothetical protein
MVEQALQQWLAHRQTFRSILLELLLLWHSL